MQPPYFHSPNLDSKPYLFPFLQEIQWKSAFSWVCSFINDFMRGRSRGGTTSAVSNPLPCLPHCFLFYQLSLSLQLHAGPVLMTFRGPRFPSPTSIPNMSVCSHTQREMFLLKEMESIFIIWHLKLTISNSLSFDWL